MLRKKWIYGGAAGGITLVAVLLILLSGNAGGDLSPKNENDPPVDQTVSGEPAQTDDQGDSGQIENENSSDNNGKEPNAPAVPDITDEPESTEKEIENYTDEYVFPYSDMKYLEISDVKDLPLSTISLGKDELYARYGRIFDNVEVQNHFEQCNWYTAIYTEAEWKEFGDSYFFNKYEKKNLAFLEKWEKKMNQKSDEQ